MKADKVMEFLGVDRCPECSCALGDDWEFKDFSNKNIILCPQCETEFYVDDVILKEEMTAKKEQDNE